MQPIFSSKTMNSPGGLSSDREQRSEGEVDCVIQVKLALLIKNLGFFSAVSIVSAYYNIGSLSVWTRFGR